MSLDLSNNKATKEANTNMTIEQKAALLPKEIPLVEIEKLLTKIQDYPYSLENYHTLIYYIQTMHYFYTDTKTQLDALIKTNEKLNETIDQQQGLIDTHETQGDKMHERNANLSDKIREYHTYIMNMRMRYLSFATLIFNSLFQYAKFSDEIITELQSELGGIEQVNDAPNLNKIKKDYENIIGQFGDMLIKDFNTKNNNVTKQQ